MYMQTLNTTIGNLSKEECSINADNILYSSYFGVDLAVPEWEAIVTAIVLSIIIILTIIGNVLVILSVFTYKPLRIVQNFFIVSLAVADLTVAILVLPFNVAYSILGRWEFGIGLCKMWLTCDVMCCTSSILNLCAIALDRYWAITDPINYAQKRTVNRVLILIAGVWILSLLISSPPLIGWNDWPDVFSNETPCQLTSNQGYVIYSALGSFYIPLIIMTIVYIEIYVATKRRLRKRARASRLNQFAINKNTDLDEPTGQDLDSVSSETNHNEQQQIKFKKSNCIKSCTRKGRRSKIKDSLKQERSKQNISRLLPPTQIKDDSITDNADISSESNKQDIEKCTDIEVNDQKSICIIQQKPILEKSNGVYQFIEEKQKISLSKERRAARTLGIIMGVFVVCWLPFFLMYVILPFCPSCCPSTKFINFITWLGYINSGLNPVIYTIFNLDYRRAFKKLLGIN